MFVSSMLKKCVNLLSHDFSKNNSKKDAEDEVPSQVSSVTAQDLDKDNGNKNTQDICNGNLSKMPMEETAILKVKWNSSEGSNNLANLEEDINRMIQVEKDKLQFNTSCSTSGQTTLVQNLESVNQTKVTEVSNGDNVIIMNQTGTINIEPKEDDLQRVICGLINEEIIDEKDSIHELNFTEKSDSCSENVGSNLTFNLHTDTVNTIYFNNHPSLSDSIECSKIIDIDGSIHYINSENQVEENIRDQDISAGDTTQNLGATVTLQPDSDINSVNSDVESDIKNSNSDFDIDKHKSTESEIPISINETADLFTDNLAKLRENSDIQFISVNCNDTSDTKITKEELSSSARTSINENQGFKTMAELNDKCINLEEELTDLKLQLNASQQVRASLELQLTQKEEVIIKSQTEALRKHQSYKQEIKQLKDKLEEKNAEEDNTPLKELQETNKSLKLREAKLLSELNARKNDEQNYRKIMDEFEKTIATQVSELQKLNEEHTVVKRHLATLELAFSDVLQKYDRSKKIIEGFKCNEEALRQSLAASEDNIMKSEQKYESLKAHAKAQIEKCNQEILLMREQYDSEIHKLTAIVKRLEIKNASLTDSLDQKNKECSALAALCDEVTGKV